MISRSTRWVGELVKAESKAVLRSTSANELTPVKMIFFGAVHGAESCDHSVGERFACQLLQSPVDDKSVQMAQAS
jgi:hypothetical protein